MSGRSSRHKPEPRFRTSQYWHSPVSLTRPNVTLQNDLPEPFSKMLADPDSNLAETCTTKALAWVPVRDLAR